MRFFTYGVMTLATVIISTIYIFIAIGYRFDGDRLTFEQGGLMQFRSIPEGARVTVDGQKDINVKTPNKANLAAGNYVVTMSLKGYQSWHKRVDLSAGQLLWLNYTRLIPEAIKTSNVHDLPAIFADVPSPDRNWLLVQPHENSPNFTLADLRDEKKPVFTPYEIPATVLTKQNNVYGKFKVMEWDASSRFVLLRHELPAGGFEFVSFDRGKPQEAVNITQKYRLNITDAHFAGNNPNIIFAKTDDVLRRFDIAAGSASGALATAVRTFMVHGDETLVYTAEREQVTGDPASRQQVVAIYKKDIEIIARRVPLATVLRFDYTEYFDHEYLALNQAPNTTVEIIRDPAQRGAQDTRIITEFDLLKPVEHLKFSPNGRMLLAQNKNDMATHDLEEVKTYNQNLAIGADVTAPLQWLDDFYLWTDAGDNLRIFEFDGLNARNIVGVRAGYTPLLSPKGQHIFSILAGKANNFHLQSSRLVVD